MSAPDPECPGCRALQARVAELEAEVAPLRAVVGQLQTRLAQLEARLNQNSQNSSRPPSSDPPAAPTRLPKPAPSGRKPGGQPGHPGKTRFLKPIQQCHQVVSVFPEACAHCHAPLPKEPSGDALPPRRHQVLELPPVRPGVLWRKCSFGHQGEGGRGFVERMLTVVGSLRLQGRAVLEYLEPAIRAAQGGVPPSLLPEPAG
jgi:transposase